MAMPLHTAWQGSDLVVWRDRAEIERIPSSQIERVILACHGHGDSPNELAFALIELANDALLLPAETGIGGRVHFERQAFWAERNCVYWVPAARAPLPRQLRPGHWLLRRDRPGVTRMPRDQLAAVIEQWPLEGPQTWEQRKWQRIARSRAFGPVVHLEPGRTGQG
jgi:hypothetical protein